MKKIKNLTNALSIYIIVYYFFASMKLDADMRLGQANSMSLNASVFFKSFIYVGLLQLIVAIAFLFYEQRCNKSREEHIDKNE
ncbi:hypothetical protein [Erysipelothrix anatis]|uniref:hypothetical protein n=1 Tax=Erysipelothrix anatis TaxID=2683713 RepID=UPI0013595E44|nr:hypothetical protein [Erysipelothrix anatis]